MGYKCPICLEDFGKDKETWTQHCKKEHYGAGKVFHGRLVNLFEGESEEGDKGGKKI